MLYTEVTTSCSNHCNFCPVDLVERRGLVHPDVQRGVLNLIASSPSRKFVVYPHLVGEPLLFPGLREYLQALASMSNVELWLCTNGVFLDGPRLRELEESGLRNIWFSMFYATPADYRKHTRSDHFEAAKRNLCLLLAHSSRFDRIHIVLFSKGTAELETLVQDKPNVTLQMERDVHPWKFEGRLYGRRVFRSLFSSMGKLRTKYVCVAIDGKVCFDWRDYNFRNCLGNIRDLAPAGILHRLDAGVIDVLKTRIYDLLHEPAATYGNRDFLPKD